MSPLSASDLESAGCLTPAAVKTYSVITWGCQMNVEDSEQIAAYLSREGFVEAADSSSADIVLLNTCSVRKKPEDKAFSMLGVLRDAKELNPGMVIGVCGCMAQLRADEIRRRAPYVDFVVGTAEISSIPGLITETVQSRKFAKRLKLPERTGAIVTELPTRRVIEPGTVAKLKAFVPIQYGCDKFCAFCIVPTTRGRERSRPTEEILEEIAILAAQGTKEITLLGQTVNSYGKNLLEGKVPFAQLLRRVAEIEGIERIRYTSPYPRDFRDDLVAAHRDCREVMPHCHLPVQSGDDEVLKAMKRLYNVGTFTEIYQSLRSVPRMAVTTDIIVGFPGETKEQFENTLRLVENLRFDGAFMFAYSPRPGTPAADWNGQVSRAEKQRRLGELIALQNRITLEIHEALVGEQFEVLIEGVADRQPDLSATEMPLLKGLSREFKTVHFFGNPSRIGRTAQVTATKAHQWGLFAEIVD